jgi:hypothetical protein
MAQQEAAAMEDMRVNGIPFDADDFQVGQTLFLPKAHGGGMVRVTDVSLDGEVTLMMPDKSLQKLPPGSQFMASRIEDVKTPTVASESEPF